ncbi:orotidine-5'-phosphate decarboxylase [Metabacillus schmidteae]|uniref:orotidine-5'-phosphate decarboxylase n=1 Tax=Metabacillus schmidteae TaxID=2730405 RepID=UPI00158BE53A|nr:orotidine-5'-phosphate decarboxylase [Metabacillus schmidteae]
MEEFSDLVIKTSMEKESSIVVGLDPIISYFPKNLQGNGNICKAIYDFNKLVIDVIHPFVVAIKPQLAYYEVYGSKGILALEKTIKYAKSKGLIIINDAKRGDIGSTAEAYSEAFLGESSLSSHAVTVNPFLGSDGIVPFLNKSIEYSKGLFILLKTSNPSSGELQDLTLYNGNKFYMYLASLLKGLSTSLGNYGFSNLGAVVGATYPEQSKNLREYLPNTLFLVPGYGEQGGKLTELEPFFNNDGNGSLISSSRSILYSYIKEEPEEWGDLKMSQLKEIIEATCIKFKEDINRIR